MQFTSISSLAILLYVATASAAPQVEKRQGGAIYATQTFYSARGCTGAADGEATFGGTNLCQSLRTVLGSVVSVKPGSVQAGCKVHYYTDAACTKGDTVGVIGVCSQSAKPFVATNVIC